ncbi:MAG: hypothetical protein A3F41_06800 [Coxiella sp. RIFCSPHIGHO2_12_FULL_44_14]|nr:MAG: hypothetical protein A3F41_06800 [Coxiella sp. RIFCSPHIGHO2_12_FULL_44_14]
MEKTWILIANASMAKIFKVNKLKFLSGTAKLNLIEEFTHPASRKKSMDMVSDRLGRYRAHGGEGLGHGAYAEPTDPKAYEIEHFAHELVEKLEAGRVSHQFEDIILVASPHFYGLMNKSFHEDLRRMITTVIEKDYTKDGIKALEEHLLQQLSDT